MTRPGTPQELWPWFTDPRKQLKWQAGLTAMDETVDGRRGVGSVNHCAHGGQVTIQQVLDWQPFASFTRRDEPEGWDVGVTITTSFEQQDTGTNVTMYFACEPAEAWAQVEAIRPVLELSNQQLVAILEAPATPG